MSAQGRRGRKHNVVPDDAVVPDMTAIHEVAAIANSSYPAAGHAAGIHRDLLSHRAAVADLQPAEFAAIAQGLRRCPQRDEWVNRAVIADRGLSRDMHVRHQPAVVADDNVGTDDAVGTYIGTLADDSAVFNARGGIDTAHRSAICRHRNLMCTGCGG